MEGNILINLTGSDVTITDESGKLFVVKGNPELETPYRRTLKEDDNFINTYYLSSNNMEGTVALKSTPFSEYIKYPFTEDQIKKINSISKGRTRLFILSKQDARYWSTGKFQHPFRHYRIFVVDNQHLIEYQKPSTYLDTISSVVTTFTSNTSNAVNTISSVTKHHTVPPPTASDSENVLNI